MIHTTDNNKKPEDLNSFNEETKRIERHKRNQTDPQITELKGFIDPNEKLEPDNEKEISKDGKD